LKSIGNLCKFAFILFVFAFPALSGITAPLIRVELSHAPAVSLFCPDEMNINLPNGEPIFLGREVSFRSEPGGISINGRLFKTDTLSIHPHGVFELNKHHYHGSLEVRKADSDLEIINRLDLEAYLDSVVGSEVSSRWPEEALKAQAVVARTYALEKMDENKALPFDVVGNYEDQAYDGVEGESSSTRQAVESTRGEALTYQGKIITAYYHADCGGRTEKGENIFQGPLPYLQSVVCPFATDSPYRHWTKTYSLAELSERFGRTIHKIALVKDPESGRVASVTLETAKSAESLPAKVFRKLLGTRDLRSTQFDATEIDKTVYVPKEESLPPETITEYVEKEIMQAKKTPLTLPVPLTDKIDLMSRTGGLVEVQVSSANPLVAIASGGFLYTIYQDLSAEGLKTAMIPETITVAQVKEGPERKKTVWVPQSVPVGVTFDGRGWGHGVGLCQWGSRGMALLGKTYHEILHYYYQNVQLEKIYE